MHEAGIVQCLNLQHRLELGITVLAFAGND